MQDAKNKFGIFAAFAAIYVLWGSTYLAVTLALGSLPPFFLMAARCLVGGAILFLATGFFNVRLHGWSTWVLAAACGALFFVRCHGVLAYAQQRVPSGFAAVLLATIPLRIALLQVVLPWETTPSKSSAAWLLPGIAGGVQISDILLLLGAAFSWAVSTMLSKRYAEDVMPFVLASRELIAGGAILLIISLYRGELTDFKPADVSLSALAGLLYLTLAGTVIAFAAYVWLLKKVSPTVVATYTFVNPVIAVLLGWLVLGERPSIWMLVGATLVIVAIAGLLSTEAKAKTITVKHLDRPDGNARSG
jgi:drug/metabolite transporter (DMT)-like permease